MNNKLKLIFFRSKGNYFLTLTSIIEFNNIENYL